MPLSSQRRTRRVSYRHRESKSLVRPNWAAEVINGTFFCPHQRKWLANPEDYDFDRDGDYRGNDSEEESVVPEDEELTAEEAEQLLKDVDLPVEEVMAIKMPEDKKTEGEAEAAATAVDDDEKKVDSQDEVDKEKSEENKKETEENKAEEPDGKKAAAAVASGEEPKETKEPTAAKTGDATSEN